ncbi:MAG: cytidylyltransferase [Hyphomicrobiales bacterium]|nr:MAG: cytidylyltransferase [Hyphomicrobiales bacterium]
MIVYTVGTFDLLHIGHLALLNRCKALGDTVAVGVASDEVVNRYKPNVPIVPLEHRMEMLLALECVDIVLPYHELEYVSGCREVNADIFVVGEDWGRKPHNLAIEDYLRSEGKQIIQVSYHPKTSSSKIKQTVVAQYKVDAAPFDVQISPSTRIIPQMPLCEVKIPVHPEVLHSVANTNMSEVLKIS